MGVKFEKVGQTATEFVEWYIVMFLLVPIVE